MKTTQLIAFHVVSETNPNRHYKVVLKKWGKGHHRLWCDCLDFRYRRRDCKHIRAAKEALKLQVA